MSNNLNVFNISTYLKDDIYHSNLFLIIPPAIKFRWVVSFQTNLNISTCLFINAIFFLPLHRFRGTTEQFWDPS